MEPEIEQIKCGLCNNEMTHLVSDDEVEGDTQFDIMRSNKSFEIEDGNVQTCDESVKMQLTICEACFLKILNESKTLGDHFLDVKQNKFIY